MGYKKTVTVKGDNNNSSASEFGSFNRVYVDANGWPVAMGVLFVIVLICAALGWLITHEGGLVAFMITASFICLFLGAGAVGTMFLVRYYSGTKRQLASDKAGMAWEQLVMYTDSHIISRDPGLRIENGREISEVRHFNDKPMISEYAESKRAGNLQASDAFSEVLNRNTANGNY